MKEYLLLSKLERLGKKQSKIWVKLEKILKPIFWITTKNSTSLMISNQDLSISSVAADLNKWIPF